MPGIELGAQTRKPFAESPKLRLHAGIRITGLVGASLLRADGGEREVQFVLRMVPVITVPFKQEHFQVGLGAREFIGSPSLSLEGAETRFEFGQNIEHAFEIALGGFESFDGIVAAGTI